MRGGEIGGKRGGREGRERSERMMRESGICGWSEFGG